MDAKENLEKIKEENSMNNDRGPILMRCLNISLKLPIKNSRTTVFNEKECRACMKGNFEIEVFWANIFSAQKS